MEITMDDLRTAGKTDRRAVKNRVTELEAAMIGCLDEVLEISNDSRLTPDGRYGASIAGACIRRDLEKLGVITSTYRLRVRIVGTV